MTSISSMIQHLQKTTADKDYVVVLLPKAPLSYVSLLPFKIHATQLYKQLPIADEQVQEVIFYYDSRGKYFFVSFESNVLETGCKVMRLPKQEDSGENSIYSILRWYNEHHFALKCEA